MSLVGAICAHGRETTDDTIVIIPQNIELYPLADKQQSLTRWNVLPNIDLYNDIHGRRIVLSTLYNQYKPGYALRNLELNFNVTFEDTATCHTTGIMTYGRLHDEFLNVSDYKTNTELRNELMCWHEDAIIPKDQIWDKTIDLGNVLKLIENSKKFGKYIGMFCRSKNVCAKNTLPKFVTVKLTNDIFHSFFDKLDSFEIAAISRNISEFSLTGITLSKLKIRVILDELCKAMRQKLLINNTISQFEFYSVIEIYYTKIIPFECTIFTFDIKLRSLIKLLSKMDTVTCELKTMDEKLFLTGLLTLCYIFSGKLEEYMVKYQKEAFDNVIFIAEKVIEEQTVTFNWYKKIVVYCEVLGV